MWSLSASKENYGYVHQSPTKTYNILPMQFREFSTHAVQGADLRKKLLCNTCVLAMKKTEANSNI